MAGHDGKEGIDAFVNTRKPNFREFAEGAGIDH